MTPECYHRSEDIIFPINGNVLCLKCKKEWVPRETKSEFNDRSIAISLKRMEIQQSRDRQTRAILAGYKAFESSAWAATQEEENKLLAELAELENEPKKECSEERIEEINKCFCSDFAHKLDGGPNISPNYHLEGYCPNNPKSKYHKPEKKCLACHDTGIINVIRMPGSIKATQPCPCKPETKQPFWKRGKKIAATTEDGLAIESISHEEKNSRPGNLKWLEENKTKQECDCSQHEHQACDICQGITGKEKDKPERDYYTKAEVDELFTELKKANLQILENHHETHRGIQAEEREWRKALLDLLDQCTDMNNYRTTPSTKDLRKRFC